MRRTEAGHFVLHAVVPCGTRQPGMVRDAYLTVTPAALICKSGEPRAVAA